MGRFQVRVARVPGSDGVYCVAALGAEGGENVDAWTTGETFEDSGFIAAVALDAPGFSGEDLVYSPGLRKIVPKTLPAIAQGMVKAVMDVQQLREQKRVSAIGAGTAEPTPDIVVVAPAPPTREERLKRRVVELKKRLDDLPVTRVVVTTAWSLRKEIRAILTKPHAGYYSARDARLAVKGGIRPDDLTTFGAAPGDLDF